MLTIPGLLIVGMNDLGPTAFGDESLGAALIAPLRLTQLENINVTDTSAEAEVEPFVVPEPGSLLLVALGVFGVGFRSRRTLRHNVAKARTRCACRTRSVAGQRPPD